MFAFFLPSVISAGIASIALLSMAQPQPPFRPFQGAPNSTQPFGSRPSAPPFPGTPTSQGQMPGGGTSIPKGPTVGGKPMPPMGRPQAGPQPNFSMGGKPMQPMGRTQPNLPALPMSSTSAPIIAVTFTRRSLPNVPTPPSLSIAPSSPPSPPPPARPFPAFATTPTTPATTLSISSATSSAMHTTATSGQSPGQKKHNHGKDVADGEEGNSDFESGSREGDYGSEEDEIGVIEKTSNLTSGEDNRDVDSLMLDISSSALEDSDDIDESGAKESANDGDLGKKIEDSDDGEEKKNHSVENTSAKTNGSDDSIWGDASDWDDSSTDRSVSMEKPSTAAPVGVGNDTKEISSPEAPNSEDEGSEEKSDFSSEASLLAGLSKSLLRSVLNDANDEDSDNEDDGGPVNIGGLAPTQDDSLTDIDIGAPYDRPRPRVLPWPGEIGTISVEGGSEESGEVGAGYIPPSQPAYPRPFPRLAPQPRRIMPPLNIIGGRHDGLDEAIYGPMLPPNVLPPIHRGASLEEGGWGQRQALRPPPFAQITRQAVQLRPTLTRLANREAVGGANYRVKPGDFVG